MDAYKILGIDKSASPEEIRVAYRKLVAKYHPDKGGDSWVFQQVQDAYEELKSKTKTGQGPKRKSTSSRSAPNSKKKSSSNSKTNKNRQANNGFEKPESDSSSEFDFSVKTPPRSSGRKKRHSKDRMLLFNVIGSIGGAFCALFIAWLILRSEMFNTSKPVVSKASGVIDSSEPDSRTNEAKTAAANAKKQNHEAGMKNDRDNERSFSKSREPANGVSSKRSNPVGIEADMEAARQKQKEVFNFLTDKSSPSGFPSQINRELIEAKSPDKGVDDIQIDVAQNRTNANDDEATRFWALLKASLSEYDAIVKEPTTQIRREKVASWTARFNKLFHGKKFEVLFTITDYVKSNRGEYRLQLSNRLPRNDLPSSYDPNEYFHSDGFSEFELLDSISIKLSDSKAREIKPNVSLLRVKGTVEIFENARMSQFDSQRKFLPLFGILNFHELTFIFSFRNYKTKVIQPESIKTSNK